VSQGLAGKAKGIDPFYVNTAPDLTVATYFTSKQYAEENPEVVERFVKAMEQSLDYAQNNPDAVREILGEYTQIPPEVAQEITLPQWRSDITLPTVEQLSALSLEYGLIESEPDLNELIAD
jgi:NitT/TauT family transport system substrate-binding protein